MTPEQSLLTRGHARLRRGLGTTFTAEGLDGEHSCLMETTTMGVEPGVAGARNERLAVLSFDRSIPYNPRSGALVTVDGEHWRVESVIKSHVKIDLNLISVDE